MPRLPTIRKAQVQLWYKRFKEDREDVSGNACPGRPITSTKDENIEAVKTTVVDNRRIINRGVADMLAYRLVQAKRIY